MKLITVFFLGLSLSLSNATWLTDFSQAKTEAKQTGKYVLVNFSGSDWCIPCIRMHKTIFESEAFSAFAQKDLVLVNADFPRLGKHRLSATQQKMNDALAEQYNPEGKFPYTLLLNSEGKVMKAWDGCPEESPEKFVAEINSSIHGGN